jgi:hypothetical protein
VSEPEMVECPMCKGAGGCPICTDGFVKKSNLDRARENSRWSDDALTRLWGMVAGPMRCRRERVARQRAYLEMVEPPSRLDDLDREHKHRRSE